MIRWILGKVGYWIAIQSPSDAWEVPSVSNSLSHEKLNFQIFELVSKISERWVACAPAAIAKIKDGVGQLPNEDEGIKGGEQNAVYPNGTDVASNDFYSTP